MHEVNDTAGALRDWAKGMYGTEAAVEVLIRALGGRLLAGPWIAANDAGDGLWFDTSQIEQAGYLSGGEYRVLLVAASLADASVTVSLSHVLGGLDRETLDVLLAGMAHAGGSHEHSNFVTTAGGGAYLAGIHPSLHPWPAG